MVSPRVRPRFELPLDLAPDDVLARVRRALGATPPDVEGIVLPETAELVIPERDRHFWSPTLLLSVQPSDGGAVVRGRFGPHHHVWALFVAIYAVLAFVAVCGAILGFSQWTLGTTPWALWALPPAAGLAAATYFGALAGQKLGHEQMDRLRTFLDASLLEASPTPEAQRTVSP